MRYSPSTGGFYPEDIPYPVLPADLINIEDSDHASLMAAQAAGQIIVPGTDGVPVAIDPPSPDIADLRGGMRLSFAQLLIGLVGEGWITAADGDAWLAGTLPAPVTALIATLPQAAQFPARARALRPSEVLRTDPLVAALALAQGKTDAKLDEFFQDYASV